VQDADYDFAELYPVSELVDRLPPLAGGAQHSPSKIYVWLNLAGTRDRTLRSIVIGRNRYTCDRWLREFIDEGSSPRPLNTRTPAKREKARLKAKASLAAAGI
jgi:hypothetical protein